MVSEQGFLGDASLSSSKAGIPAYVELKGNRLLWTWWDPADPTKAPHEAEPKGMLDTFVRIQDGPAVLRFARRYGVLGICEHGLPASHNPPPPSPAGSSRVWWCYPLGWSEDVCWEPLDRWYYFAGLARALVAIAANFRQNKPGSADDWRAVFAAHPRERIDALCERLGQLVESGRFYLGNVLLEWLAWGNVRPALDWPVVNEAPSLSFTGGTFGILGIQLLFAIAGAHSVAICSGCGVPYLRKYKPRPDRRNFCLKCGEKTASRLRQRDYQQKRRTTDEGPHP